MVPYALRVVLDQDRHDLIVELTQGGLCAPLAFYRTRTIK